MARRYLWKPLLVVALCNLHTSSLSLAQDDRTSGARPNGNSGQGLLSRMRGATTKPTETDEPKDRRWTGGMKVPLQSFNLPWSNRSADSKSSIQDPIDLPKAIQSKGAMSNRPNSRSSYRDSHVSAPQTPSNAIGSGVARRATNPSSQPPNIEPKEPAPAPQDQLTSQETIQESSTAENSIDTSSRKELRVYEAAPSLQSIDSKNTSRRKPVTPAVDTKPSGEPKPSGIRLPKIDLPAADLPAVISPAANSPAEIPPAEILSRVEIGPAPSAGPLRVPASLATTSKPKSASTRNAPNNPQERSAPLDVRAPQLRLRVDGPQAIQVGQKATYTIHATNEGTSELQGLIIRASTPKGVKIDGVKTMVGAYEMDQTPDDTGVLWELEKLAANDSKSLDLQIEVLEADQFALNLEWTVSPSPTQMNVQVHQPKLQLELSGASDVEAGVPQKYRMRIKNSGTADLQDLALCLQTETTSQYESQVGPIPAGSEKIVDVELTFDQVGLFPIVATAKDPSGKFEQRQRIDVQVQKVDLKASWFGPDEFIQGTQADYELVIQNIGGIAAKNIACSIDVPEGIEILELPQGILRTGNQIRWSLQTLDPKTQFTLPMRCDMVRSGSQTMAFQAGSERNLVLQSKITTQVEAISDLELSVKEPQAPAPVGTPVVYEIQVVNRGSKAAENVRVVAQFSEGIEPLKIEGHTGRIVPGQALFDSLPQIGPKQTLILKVICQASNGGVHRFRAAVQSPDSQEDLLEEGSTRFVASGTKPSKP